jgi:hypothetical protein
MRKDEEEEREEKEKNKKKYLTLRKFEEFHSC